MQARHPEEARAMPDRRRFALLLLTALALMPCARGGTTATPLSGTFNNSQDNACIQVSLFFYLADCSYGRSRAVIGGQELPWVGPTVNPVYFAPGSPHAVPGYAPKPGDDRIRPAMTGSLTIDDRGTKDASDDLISGALTVGPAARSVVSNINSQAGRPPRLVEKWQAIRHTLAPTAVDAATRNDAGGFDYVIGKRGFPALLCRKDDSTDCYTSARAPKTTDGPAGADVWAGPPADGIGVERAPVWGGGNPGATTTAEFDGYSCADEFEGRECLHANVAWGSDKEDPGLDNLLLKVSTDSRRRIRSVRGFWTNEYYIQGGPPAFQVQAGEDNSWQGGYLQLEPVAAPTAVAVLLLHLLATPAFATGPALLRPVVDANPDPRIIETTLVAEERDVDLDGRGQRARMYTFNGGTPGPEFRARVGDRVIVHFTNQIDEPLMVHWHGIELHNASDGTTLTQNPLRKGESFTYDFIVPRAGVFWYHSHRAPTNPEFKGMYGAFIVTGDHDATLVRRQVLPPESLTRTLVLADTTVCKAPGRNDAATFPADAALPWSFTRAGLGRFPGHAAWPTPRDLCEDPRDEHGMPLGTGPLPAGSVPNVQPAMKCGVQPKCRVNEGQLVLVNGRLPGARAGSPDAPGALADAAAAWPVKPGDAVRLRLVNAAVSRFFRLRLTDARGALVPILRVGGQGGLLDRVRIEGGAAGQVDLKYERGELVLAPSERADVVLVMPPAAASGDVLTLWTEDFSHYGTNEYPYGYGSLPSVPVAHFAVSGRASGGKRALLAAGDPLRTHPAVNAPVENLRSLPVTAHLLDPATLDPPLAGTRSEEILLTVLGLRESIDGVHATVLHGPDDLPGASFDYRAIPHVPSSRYARVGDLLELTFRNGTQQHHPLHLHGFSFQPLRMLDTQGRTVHEYDYNEFIDSIDIPDLRSVVVRVRLDDRTGPDRRTAGGAVGRWFIHCHIFNHAELGMMTELVVLPRLR